MNGARIEEIIAYFDIDYICYDKTKDHSTEKAGSRRNL